MNSKKMNVFKAVFVIGLLLAVQGCGIFGFLKPEKKPYNRDIARVYLNTKLNKTPALDVYYMDEYPENQLLSQSKKAIAITGKSKDAHKRWFNLVAFDQDKRTATRKYLMIVDEKHKVILADPRHGMSFYTEMVMDDETLNKNYPTDDIRKIRILEKVKQHFEDDIENITTDNKNFRALTMMFNQAFRDAMHTLDKSPSNAQRLDQPDGLIFNHISMDKGRIGLDINSNIVSVKMKLGTYRKYFEKGPEDEKGWEWELF